MVSNLGIGIFSQTISINRFKYIIRFVRFNLKTKRPERLKTDKFVLSSAVWNPFIKNIPACFKSGGNLKIDEKMLLIKSKMSSTQYIPITPVKFGMQFWLFVCVESKYILEDFPYICFDISRPTYEAVNEHVLIWLTEGFLKK